MNRTMGGIHQKLVRAQKHFDEIVQVLASIADDECSVIIKNNFDMTECVLQLPEPNLYFSVIVGDFLHNLRSALDNLVFGIAEHHTSGRTEEERRANQFPIFLVSDDYDGAEARMLNGLPTLAKTFIKGLQP